ncbi:hypothetical protein SAMN05421690_1001113 [Nitrosomonas sp. Nm51]|uniref:hypothetical protein n=1 Tax=Nitrosomonas sp. Nm51 TaxID=133720 RepID=UPI0008BA3B67|nr:hypothetical protein [Nitrosomonas sp. Nm51]SEQ77670.1 hypothetical protein SAMN05421690_1001113 [Nitrosomonas sp. Nm51]
MNVRNLYFHFFTVLLGMVLIIPPVAAEAAKYDAKNKAFYSQLSCKASTRAVVALAESMEARGFSQLDFNKVIIEALQGTALSPNGPRWECCRACVDNDQPNDSAACQCCDGLGDNVIDIQDVEKH